jgi:hypothetical protein
MVLRPGEDRCADDDEPDQECRSRHDAHLDSCSA